MNQRIVIFLLPLLLVACRVQQPMSSERFAQDVQSDIPFKVSTMNSVPNHTGVYAFLCENQVDLLPDYEVDAEGAVMVYRTTFAPTHEKQPSNVIWRNIIINHKAKRVLCIDRLVQNSKTNGYIYVLQSETKAYSDENTFHWDVSDHRLMLNVAGAIEDMTSLSITQMQMMASQLILVGCTTNKPAEANIENVPFEVAKNYFFKNNQTIPASPKITTKEAFDQLFGMAAFMGKDGQPTPIDFDKQFVLAIVLPVTDIATEIIPMKVEIKGDQLFYSYEVKTGEQQSFSIQPVSIIILDKQFENHEVVEERKENINN